MKIIELFSGIGGFTKGFLNAGYTFEEHYFSEIDKYAIANYKYNFPNAKHIGSVTTIPNGSFTDIDIITFGSPCQDFSLAGQRKGLEGNRSSLITEAIRLIADIRPSVFIWENVKGTFSSNSGQDFWAILQAFANIGGYRLEWQLLNTRWFLPQNRERMYLVGHLAGRSEPKVFPFAEDDTIFNRKKTPKIRSQKETIKVPGIARCLTGGGNSGGLHSDMTTIEVGTFRTYKEDNGFRKTKENICPTLPARARNDASGSPVISEKSNIRRLTEIECERLQGFDDDWTKFGDFDGIVKEISATQRYKMIGNAVSVPIVEEIARRLKN